jgi:hypothetical protein
MSIRLALAVAALPLALAVTPAQAQTRITVGQEIAGNLSDADSRLADGSLYECFVLEPGSGPVTIDLKTAYFDAFLAVGTGSDCGDGMRVLASDDDGGTNTNARVVQTFTAPRILIRANAFGAGETGNFWLSVTAGAPVEAPRQGSLTALPQGASEWETDAETCTGAYRAMEDAATGVGQYGNVSRIDYAARARTVDARRPAYSTDGILDIISSNFVLIALGGVIDDKPEQVAEYLEAVAACDRAFGFTPVTTYR